MTKSKYTREYLIDALVRYHNITGDFPLMKHKYGKNIHWEKEISEVELPCYMMFYHVFGSYREALKIAAAQLGIKYERRRTGPKKGSYNNKNKMSRDYLFEKFKECLDKKGELPTRYGSSNWHPRFKELTLPNPNTYVRHFGSMQKAKEEFSKWT